MKIWMVLMICIGLSLDVYAVTICQGAMLENISRKTLLATSGIFLLFQVAAVGIGSLLGVFPVAKNISHDLLLIWRTISMVIIIILGCLLLYRGIKNKLVMEHRQVFTARKVRSAATWTSIDVLLTSAGLSAWNINAIELLITIGATTLAAVFAGLYTGYLLGYEQIKKHISAVGLF